MLSISKPIQGKGRWSYYANLSREDYYANAADSPGYWFGDGAQYLGLSGKVDPKALHSLFSGLSPDGQTALVQNALAPDRQSGIDLTFSDPKAVSSLYATLPPEQGALIQQCRQEALEYTLRTIEARAGYTRRGKGGANMERAALVFAVFHHATSRALDPQLHTHVVLINLGVRPDGTTGYVVTRPIFQMKKILGAIYQTQLAFNLRRRLGLVIEPEKVGFHIKGVPRELCARFSKRAQEIKAELKRCGRSDAVTAKLVTLKTRPQKVSIPFPELRARWQVEALSVGWSAAQALKLIRGYPAPRDQVDAYRARLQESIGLLPPDRRHPARLVHLATQMGIEHGVDAPTVLQALEDLPQMGALPFFRIEWRRVLAHDPPWVAARQRLVTIESKQLFPLAPWRFARKLRLPVIAVELPRLALGRKRPFRPKWNVILWKQSLVLGEVRVQNRHLFPNAPSWSPARHATASTLRLTARKSKTLKELQNQGLFHSH